MSEDKFVPISVTMLSNVFVPKCTQFFLYQIFMSIIIAESDSLISGYL